MKQSDLDKEFSRMGKSEYTEADIAKTLADEIIKKAHALSGGARDDMTVLVAKIFSLK